MRKVLTGARGRIAVFASLAFISCVAVALADQLSVDGDTLVDPPNIKYEATATNTAHACDTRSTNDTPTSVPGLATVRYNGSTHYNQNANVDVIVTPDADATLAGITATGGSATVPSGTSWNGSGDQFTVPISTTVPATVPDGTYTINVKSTGPGANNQGAVNPYEETASYNVIVDCDDGGGGGGNHAPVITVLTVEGNCQPTANFEFTDEDANDSHTGSVDWKQGANQPEEATRLDDGGTPPVFLDAFSDMKDVPYTGDVNTSFSVDATVSDGTDSDTQTWVHTLKAESAGLLQPVDRDGSSVFKLGSTIPLKIKAVDCDGDSAGGGLTPDVALKKIANADNTPVDEAVTMVVPTNGKTMRYVLEDDQYIFNLSTKKSQFNAGQDLSPGKYEVTITDDELVDVVEQFNIKK